MAYYNSNQSGTPDPSLGMNKKEDEAVAGAPGAAPQVTNNAANAAAPAPAGPTAAPLNGNPIPQNQSAPKASSSGMGGGFQSYQKANQGAATSRLNSAVQKNVSAQGNAAQTSINQATDQFGKKVDAGTLANRYQAVSDVANTVNSARTLSAAPAAPLAAPLAATASPAPAPAMPNVAGADRFKEVINAKYQGPESLRQSGLYQGAADKTQQAQTTLNQTKTASGREDMLKDMYSKRGEYTRGLNKLDSAVLNSSQSGVKDLQNTAQAQGNLSQKLDKAQLGSGNLAQNRKNEITGIRDEARSTFSAGKKAEEAATDERLSKVVENWDTLPEHFRDIIRNKEKDNKASNSAEAGNNKGSPEYLQAQQELAAAQSAPARSAVGISAKLVAENERKAKIAAAQSKLAGLETKAAPVNSKSVNLNSAEAQILGVNSGEGLYNLGADAIKTAAFDKEKLISRDEQARQGALSQLAGLDNSNMLDTNLKYSNAGKAGTQTAMDALDLAGLRSGLNEAEEGFQDYAEGANLTGQGSKKNKTSGKRYYSEASANVGNLLKKSGYEFGNTGRENIGNAELLKNLGKVTDQTGDEDLFTGLEQGAAAPYTDNRNTAQMATQGAVDYASGGIIPAMRALGIDTGFADTSKLFGGGANSAASKKVAKSQAQRNLDKKVQGALNSSGFENRFSVQNNENTNSRLTALQQLMAKLDKTNS